MKAPRLLFLIGTIALLSGTALALATSYARAEDSSIFDSQQMSPDDLDTPQEKNPHPHPLDMTGEWSGTLNDPIMGAGTLDIGVDETRSGRLSGEWTLSFSNVVDIGTIVGRATPNRVAMKFIFEKKAPFIHCRFSIDTKDLVDDSELTANFHFTACGPHTHEERGTLELESQ